MKPSCLSAVTRAIALALTTVTMGGCRATAPSAPTPSTTTTTFPTTTFPPAAPAVATPGSPTAVPITSATLPEDLTSTEKVFPAPASIAPVSWFALGPFLPTADEKKTPHASLAHDYLVALGGEARARIGADATVDVDGKATKARPVQALAGTVDFAALYDSTPGMADTNDRLAYAYAELDQKQPSTALVLFGSDDGASVWVNGERVHHAPFYRGLDPSADRFDLPLAPGKNRILIKVDNGSGGWGFALRILDGAGRRRLEALEARRYLERLTPVPPMDHYLLASSFPELAWRHATAADLVFGAVRPSIRWFGPDLQPVTRPEANGRYAAVVEAKTRDGHWYRRMVSFAKVPAGIMPRFQTAPYSEELPPLTLPRGANSNANDKPKANADGKARATQARGARVAGAQRLELSRHVWRAGGEALARGENSAIAAAALFELKETPPPEDEPAWLSSGFITNAAYHLALRMKLEGRTPRPLPPPTRLARSAGILRPGSERQAGMKAGTTEKLRKLARAWAAADPNGFVVLVARHGVVFLHEGWNGLAKDSSFYPASISKTVAALLFARAAEQGLLTFDTPVSRVLPAWGGKKTERVTFRHCFNHVAGFHGHRSHDGLFNAYLDNALLTEDAPFSQPGRHYIYEGDALNLAGKALELTTGTSIWRLLYEQMEKPFEESVMQTDLGAGGAFTALYLAKLGQMILQDGAYGPHRFFSPGLVRTLYPRRAGEFAPDLADQKQEVGIGFEWMPDPMGPREKGVLGPNVVGHGASSGTIWRVALDHGLIVVVGRSTFKNGAEHVDWVSKFVAAVATGLAN